MPACPSLGVLILTLAVCHLLRKVPSDFSPHSFEIEPLIDWPCLGPSFPCGRRMVTFHSRHAIRCVFRTRTAFHQSIAPPSLRLGRGSGGAGVVLPPSPSRSLCLQDEVAHTVTESRVLQNTRHPFLTVSGTSLSGGAWPLHAPCGKRAQPCRHGARTSCQPGGQGWVLLRSPK